MPQNTTQNPAEGHVATNKAAEGPHFFPSSLGTAIKPSDVCTGKLHVQPELASGARSMPPAGIRLIQQPGRVVAVSFRVLLVVMSKDEAVRSRKKKAEAEADSVPHPPRLPSTQGHFHSCGSPCGAEAGE